MNPPGSSAATVPRSFGSMNADQVSSTAFGFSKPIMSEQGQIPSVTSSWGNFAQTPWRQGQSTQSSNMNIDSIGIGALETPNPPSSASIMAQQQQTPGSAVSPQLTTRIDDVTAYGTPWLFTTAREGRSTQDQVPLATLALDITRARHRSMSPGFKYNHPISAASPTFFPSSFGFRYGSRTPPDQPRGPSEGPE